MEFQPPKPSGKNQNKSTRGSTREAHLANGSSDFPLLSWQGTHASSERVPMFAVGGAPEGGWLMPNQLSNTVHEHTYSGNGSAKVSQTVLNTPNLSALDGTLAMEKEKEKNSTRNKVELLEIGIKAMELVQGAVAMSSKALGDSSLISEPLKMITGALVILKKMVQNRQAWDGLRAAIDGHQKVFDEQIQRMEIEDPVPDPESPLLLPINRYATALEDIMEEVIRGCRFEQGDARNGTAWGKIKNITARAVFVDLEKERIEGYTQKLSDAMNGLKVSLQVFTSFTLRNVKHGIARVDYEVLLLGKNIKDLRETVIRSSGHKDTISRRHITAFGGQHSTCLTGTRVDVLDNIRRWAHSSDPARPQIYCIADVAGTGKSTIAKTLAQEWYSQGCLVAMFFFSQEASSLGTASDFCLSVADQIEEFDDSPDLIAYWKSISRSRKNLPSRDVGEQWSRLVLKPLAKLKSDERNYILVIDALDECTEATRGPLLESLLAACHWKEFPRISILLTTRMENDLRNILQKMAYPGIAKFISLRHSQRTTDDIHLYINHRLDLRGILVSCHKERHELILRSDGLFIFAHLACTLLEKAHTEKEPLIEILHGFTSLDALYHRTLMRADKEPRYTREQLKNLLRVIIAAQFPLPVITIATLLRAPPNSVLALIESLGSVLASGGLESPVYILHATFTEFLLRQNWINADGEKLINEYAISKSQSNRVMAWSCLEVLLRKPTSNTSNPYLPPRSHPSHDVSQTIPAPIRYASYAWVFHVAYELHIPAIRDAMKQVFEERILNWIEIGAIMRQLPYYMKCVRVLQVGMGRVQDSSTENKENLQWCTDTLTFLRIHQTLIQTHPNEVYLSALAFTPHDNLIHLHYASQFRGFLPETRLGSSAWNINNNFTCQNASYISRVAYSSGGQLIAVAIFGMSSGSTISVWDVESGANLSTHRLIENGLAGCHELAFLPGNETIVSIWQDGRLHRLTRKTGRSAQLPVMLDPTAKIACAAWSPDLTQFVCGFKNGQIRIFSLQTGLDVGQACVTHDDKITSVTFSPNGKLVASTSRDKTFKIWELTPQNPVEPFVVIWNHTNSIVHGAFSPTDSSLFAFIDEASLFIYDITSKATEIVHSGLNATSFIFSRDGERVITQERNSNSVIILGLRGGNGNESLNVTKIETGHKDGVECIALSPNGKNLVSGGVDRTIRVHHLATNDVHNITPEHHDSVYLMAFSWDRKRLVSVDRKGILCVWDVERGELIQEPFYIEILEEGGDIAVSSDASIIALHRLQEIMFWNTKSKQRVGATWTLDYEDPCRYHLKAMVFSPDDKTLAVVFEDTVSGETELETEGTLTLFDIWNVHDSAGGPGSAIDIDLQPTQRRLAYHPSGRYISDGKRVWDLAMDGHPPTTGPELNRIIEEAFLPLIRFDKKRQLQVISFVRSRLRQLYLPPIPDFCCHAAQDGLLALGARDGWLILLDFSHLLSDEDRTLLNHLECTRLQGAIPPRSGYLEEVLAAYPGPPQIKIPRTSTPWPDDDEDDGLDGDYDDDEIYLIRRRTGEDEDDEVYII